MTINDKAYIDGFCKTAEAYGVDPEALLKVASMNKKAFTLVELLTVLGLTGALGYGGYKGVTALKNSLYPEENKVTKFIKQHPYATTGGAAALSALAAYALARKGKTQNQYELE